jgi:hypothetical protein
MMMVVVVVDDCGGGRLKWVCDAEGKDERGSRRGDSFIPECAGGG